MSGYRHDCTRAVTDEHIVGDPDWNALSVDRVNCVAACEHAALLASPGNTILFAHVLYRGTVSIDFCAAVGGREAVNERMLRCEHHVCCTEECVGAGRVDSE